MTLNDLFEQCADADIELIPDGPDLIVEGDADLLTPDALNVLRTHKGTILAILTEPADRELCWCAGARHGFPSVPIRPGETLAAGADTWKRFIANAAIGDVRIMLAELAIRELDQLEHQLSE